MRRKERNAFSHGPETHSLFAGESVNIEARHRVAAVTICASNFLAKALVLRTSYLAFHPASDFYILLIDKKPKEMTKHNDHPAPQSPDDISADLLSETMTLWVEDLGISGFPHYAFKFDIVELCTNVKAVVLRLLLSSYEQVLYLDPDICLYAHLQPVFDDLEAHSVVVTPHALTPVLDGESPSDIDYLRFGAFNLGFIGVSRCPEAFQFLDWWSQRCLEHGYYEPQRGLAVDQKWLDLGPAFFPGVKILRDPGLNVAFWNLHERTLSYRDNAWMVNEMARLRFFHFSSFNRKIPHAIACKQSRYPAESRPDLHPLLDTYALALRDNHDDFYSVRDYSFNYFEDGTFISPSLRRFYAALEGRFPPAENPFCRGSTFQAFALKHHLAGEKIGFSPRPTFKEMGAYSGAARVISLGLRNTLRWVGPNRYFSLMRYLAHISSIRNQSELFPELFKTPMRP
jgi:hypothetical protein